MMIRTALPTDLAAWSHMRTSLWPETDDAHIAEIREYFDGTSIDIVQAFILDNDENQAVGFMELNIRNFAEGSRQSRVPYIEGWYVEPAYQHQGWGRQLIAKAEQWALGLGFTELASDTELENHRSISLHAKLGFEETERLVCFLKKLSPQTN